MPEDTRHEALIEANEAFYAAFRKRDVRAMDALWGDGDITCIHPGWDVLVGRTQVMASWMAILTNPATAAIHCHDPVARIEGDGAVVVCGEEVQGTKMVATNTFVHDGTRWRLTHHHAGQVVQAIQFTPPADELN